MGLLNHYSKSILVFHVQLFQVSTNFVEKCEKGVCFVKEV